MSHIFSLEDLARSKVHLQFLSPDQPPNIQWRSLSRPITVAPFAKSLSIRVNLSTVDGRPSLSMFLMEDPDVKEDFCFGSSYQDEDCRTDLTGTTNVMGLYQPSPVGLLGTNFLPSYRGHSVGTLVDKQDGRIVSTPELDSSSSSRLSSPSSSIFSTPPLTNCDASLYSVEFLGSQPHTPNSEVRPSLDYPEDDSTASFLMGFDLLFQNGAQIKGHSPELSRTDFHNLTGSMMHRPGINPKGQTVSQISEFSPTDAQCNDDWPKRTRRIHGNRTRARPGTTQPKGVRKRVKCSICEETFSRRHDMMRHESAQHGKIQEWTCQACGKFFANESMLAIHDCRKRPR